MTAVVVAAASVAGGLGAAARFVLDGTIKTMTRTSFPLGTALINVVGSLLLGVTIGLATRNFLPDPWSMILGTGFLGGFTTFSTASFETVRLLQQRRVSASIVTGLGVLVLAVAAAVVGLWLGRTL